MSFKYLGRQASTPKDPRRLVIRRKGYGKNWPKQRKTALERDDYTCQYCGQVGKKVGRRWNVHVHHKRKIAYFANSETQTVDYEAANSLENLITACDSGCHKHYDGHQNKSGFKQLK